MSSLANRSNEAEQEAARLRQEWETRARTPHGRFFIASAPGWSDELRFFGGGRADCGFITTGLDPDFLREAHTLEIGCGVGRLARPLAPQVRTYTGVDISSTYLEEARRNCSEFENVRFALSDGTSLPDSCRDRRYHFIFAAAVFIHCPESVIEAWIRAAIAALAPGGELRFQLLGDASDHAGIDCPTVSSEEIARLINEREQAVEREAVELPDQELCRGTGYMGTTFTWEGARRFLDGLRVGSFFLYRPNPAFIYAAWRAPGA